MTSDDLVRVSAPPDVSVVIPHFRDFTRLDLCLAALGHQTFAGSREIIVADNNSPEGLAAVEAAVAGRARIVVATASGAGPARNAGVAAAIGRVIAFTDSDCVPEPGWLAGGVAAVAETTLAGGAMTVLSAFPGRLSPTEAFEAVFAFDNESYVRTKGFSVTANLFVPRSVFARVGPFPTGVSEDIEWCWRARDAGFALVYSPTAVVGHPARRDWPALKAKWRRLSHELFLLERERGRSVAWIVGRAALMLLELPRALVRVARTPILGSGRDRRGAAAVLTRIRIFRFVETMRMAMRRD